VLTQFNSASLNQHIKNTYQFDVFNRGFVDILAAEQTPGNDLWYQGTADAVRQSMHHTNNHEHEYVLILSGDQLYQMDFEAMAKFHIEQGADLTIATIPCTAKEATGFGIMKVNEDQKITTFYEKPTTEMLPDWTSPVSKDLKRKGRKYLASMGIYIFKRELLNEMFAKYPNAKDFGKEIIPACIHEKRVVSSYQYDGYWTDIGTIGSFFESNLALTDPVPQFNLFDGERPIYTRMRQLAPAKLFGTRFLRSVISDGVICHARKVERTILGIRARIGENTVLKNCIVMGADYYETLEDFAHNPEGIRVGVGSNCQIENAILDKNCRVGNDVIIKGGPHLPDAEHPNYSIVDGIVVLKKNCTLSHGTQIG
jgi:glucose-1-phosphate adenylyltransferase